MQKVVMLVATFPELRGGSCYQRGKGQGSNVRVATARAFANMYKNMKGKRNKSFTAFHVDVTVGTVANVLETSPGIPDCVEGGQ